MQNVKLLDLETGKYLELFRDYAYCGEAILFHGFDDDDISNYECECPDYNCDCLPTLMNGFEYMIDKDWACRGAICYKSEPPEPLKPLCEKTGAVVYGNRYVLLTNDECGNVYLVENVCGRGSFFDIVDREGNFSETHYNNDKLTLVGNPFEEYSKQLRNEPNKFEELKELIK